MERKLGERLRAQTSRISHASCSEDFDYPHVVEFVLRSKPCHPGQGGQELPALHIEVDMPDDDIALSYVVSCYMEWIPDYLRKGGNDAHWETWAAG